MGSSLRGWSPVFFVHNGQGGAMPIYTYFDGEKESMEKSLLERMDSQLIKGIDLYLTGSRYFAQKYLDKSLFNAHSDFDFAAQESEMAIEFLTSHRFHKLISNNYMDQNTASVWQCYCTVIGAMVQVSLKHDVKFFLEIQDSLTIHDYKWMKSLSKKDANRAWRVIYSSKNFLEKFLSKP
jgi:hypothetical protein